MRSPDKYAEGNGLWLVVEPPGLAYWHYRYQSLDHRQRTISFGNAVELSLADATRRHEQARAAVGRGLDPLVGWRAERATGDLGQFPAKSWPSVCELVIADKQDE